MIITSADNRNLGVVLDMPEVKYVVEVLRSATMEQHAVAAKIVAAAGFGTPDPLNSIAASRTFINMVGFFTDQLILMNNNITTDEGQKLPIN
jgi:hypothetical protein